MPKFWTGRGKGARVMNEKSFSFIVIDMLKFVFCNLTLDFSDA